MQQGYTLPLNREQFPHALHAGLGRALQHVRTHGLTGFEDELVTSCISNTAYHPQSEGSAWSHGTCSHCRDSVLETLMKRGPLPAWLVEEARLDAEEDMRARVSPKS